jgi:hypothetical protein
MWVKIKELKEFTGFSKTIEMIGKLIFSTI